MCWTLRHQEMTSGIGIKMHLTELWQNLMPFVH